MLRRKAFLILPGALAVFGALPMAAHEDIRVIGTVTKVQPAKLDVKMKDGRNVSIKMDKQTSVTRDKKKIAASALKAGQSVVVDAYGDGYEDLLALEVRIVPSIAPASSK